MRIPSVLLDYRTLTGVSVCLMFAGTMVDMPWLRGWALLFGVAAATSCVVRTMNGIAHDTMRFIQRWAQEPFESGVKQGICIGREQRIAEELEILGRPLEERLN